MKVAGMEFLPAEYLAEMKEREKVSCSAEYLVVS
jgi:hypothetical protein